LSFTQPATTERFSAHLIGNAPLSAGAGLAASGPLPPQLASHFTTGELTVLRIVGDEVKAHGVCG